jgi:hypothetical protein
MSLYEKFKGSSDKTEVQAANNVKQISDVIGALGGDKSSMTSAAISVLTGLAANKSQAAPQQSNAGPDILSAGASILGSILGKK